MFKITVKYRQSPYRCARNGMRENVVLVNKVDRDDRCAHKAASRLYNN